MQAMQARRTAKKQNGASVTGTPRMLLPVTVTRRPVLPVLLQRSS